MILKGKYGFSGINRQIVDHKKQKKLKNKLKYSGYRLKKDESNYLSNDD